MVEREYQRVANNVTSWYLPYQYEHKEAGAILQKWGVCLIYAETVAETLFIPETPRCTPRHFERRRDGRRDKGFCDTISMPN